jgi:hypothetical protein
MYSKAELKEVGLDDFRVFLVHAWEALGLPKPTKVQLDIAHYLQHGPERVVIEAFRGVGKSWITAAFVCWVLLNDPQKKIMVVSAGETLAGDFTKFVKQLIELMPVLHHLKPRPGQLDRADAFDVGPATASKDPSVKSVGITGQITGSRADVIIADDVETPKNSYTHLLRDRLADLVKEFDAVLKPLKSSRIIYLGTPQTETSLYNRLFKDRGYSIRIWPAEVPKDTARYHGRLAPYVLALAQQKPAGSPVDPARFESEDLEKRKASYGASGYALQFMLDTNPSDEERYPLKLKDLIVHDLDPQMAHAKWVWGAAPELVIQDLPAGGLEGDKYHRAAWKSPEMAGYSRIVMAIDPSGKGQDETAFAVVAEMHGLLFLLDIGGFKDGYSEATLKGLAGKCLRWKVSDVIIEENYGGGMFNELLRPHLAAVQQGRIDDEFDGWSSTQKEARIIDTLAPIMASHRLVVNRQILVDDLKVQQDTPAYSFVQQLTRIMRLKGALPHEDRLEALSMACAYFVESMAKDQNRMLEAQKDAWREEQLRKFMDNALGFSTGSGNLRWSIRG